MFHGTVEDEAVYVQFNSIYRLIVRKSIVSAQSLTFYRVTLYNGKSVYTPGTGEDNLLLQ